MGLSCSGSRAAIKTRREAGTGVYLFTGLPVGYEFCSVQRETGQRREGWRRDDDEPRREWKE